MTTTLAKPSTLKFLKVAPAKTPAGKGAKRVLIKVGGLRIKAFGTLAAQLQIPDVELAGLAGIPVRTFHRRKQKHQLLNVTETDATLRIARVVEEANRVFGDVARATRWLKSPNAILGDEPLHLLASDAGAQAVQDELTRIHWGEFA